MEIETAEMKTKTPRHGRCLDGILRIHRLTFVPVETQLPPVRV